MAGVVKCVRLRFPSCDVCFASDACCIGVIFAADKSKTGTTSLLAPSISVIYLLVYLLGVPFFRHPSQAVAVKPLAGGRGEGNMRM